MEPDIYANVVTRPVNLEKEKYFLSVSGGKDSTAVYLWAVDTFGPTGFTPVFADTDNEHPVTVNYLRNLHLMAGGPEVTIIKRDFTPELARKGLTPSGNVFEDCLRYNGQAPWVRGRFCTRQLKLEPLKDWVMAQTPDDKAPVTMNGIRAQESHRRAKMPPISFDEFFGCILWRPGFYWTTEQIFKIHEAHGVPPNPLYAAGYTRVGCMPCFMATKPNLALLPDWAWERLERWENEIIRLKGPEHSFFQGNRLPGKPPPSVAEVRQWAKTAWGGQQFKILFQDEEDTASCMTGWSICE
jgi:3'-phosphoadenosine 5'-phosphosulfate sulfotransferase (PAPS reductase)/FAD synthetase